ncbi:MAG TPA: hypothetical protein VM869_36910, partial [Enhygromyxa sp.]|nr:hypothetical protein [Enhygromyxa sp.]
VEGDEAAVARGEPGATTILILVELDEDQDRGRAGLTTRDGSLIALDLGSGELSLRILGVAGARELMLESRRRFAELTGLMAGN